MNYLENSKYRKLRHTLVRLSSSVSFNLFSLKNSAKLTFVGEIGIVATLIFPWFSIGRDENIYIFSRFLGATGLSLFLIAIILALILLSHTTKEFLKTRLSLVFSDATIVFFFGIMQCMLILSAIVYMRSLVTFTKDIVFFTPPIYALLSSMMVIVSGFLAFRESKREILSTLYVENRRTSDALFAEYQDVLSHTPSDKKNMSLPL